LIQLWQKHQEDEAFSRTIMEKMEECAQNLDQVATRLREASPAVERVGLIVEGRRAPREGYAVLRDGAPCGFVTSGAPSPTLGRSIAMAYVDAGAAGTDAPLSIDVRGTPVAATVTPLPFYRRG
ncbi:MAG: glycine cleavage T C-terminal barrel domain-containing protein, partial [Planctomycetota bacterium]